MSLSTFCSSSACPMTWRSTCKRHTKTPALWKMVSRSLMRKSQPGRQWYSWPPHIIMEQTSLNLCHLDYLVKNAPKKMKVDESILNRKDTQLPSDSDPSPPPNPIRIRQCPSEDPKLWPKVVLSRHLNDLLSQIVSNWFTLRDETGPS